MVFKLIKMNTKENFFQIILSSDSKDFIPANQQNILQNFDNVNHKVYTFRTANKEFLKNKNFIGISDAFKKVKAYAFKADLLRYYLLYQYGGWYSDINNYFTGVQINTNDIDFYAFKDIPEHSTEYAFQNSIIYAKPKHPILKSVIEEAIDNIMSEFYGEHPLYITGPTMFGKHVSSYYGDVSHLGRCTEFEPNRKNFMTANEEVFANYKPFGFTPGNSGISGGNSYNELWHSNSLYEKR